jgi:hypothetical protein
MEKCCPIKYLVLSSARVNTVQQWVFQLNSAPAAAETCDLKVACYRFKETDHMWKMK